MKISLFDRLNPLRLAQNWLDAKSIDPAGELLHLWSTPIYVYRENVLKSSWHLKLKEAIISRARAEPGSLAANWRESDLLQWREEFCQEFAKFLNSHIARRLAVDVAPATMSRLRWNLHGWANYKKGLDWHWYHLHPHCTYSYVYFLSTLPSAQEDHKRVGFNGDYYGAALEFMDPRGAAPYMASQFSPNSVEHGKFFVSPEEGLLLIFPSYLWHMVSPLTSDVERISVAGNAFDLYLADP